MKKILLAALFFTFLGQSLWAAEKTMAPPLKKVTFFINIFFPTDPFFSELKQGLEELKQKHYIDSFEIVNYHDNLKELNQGFDKAINDSSAIIMNYIKGANPDEFINRATERNIPLVFIFTPPSNVALAKHKNVFYITQDDIQSGITQGLLLSQYFKQHPDADKNRDGIITFLDISGTGYSAPDEALRFRWLNNTITSYPGSHFRVQELNIPAHYDNQKSYDLINKLISIGKIKDIEAVVAQSENMATSAADALITNNVKIPVFGRGNSPKMRQYIRTGKVVGTVESKVPEVSFYAGLMAYDYIHKIDTRSNIPYLVYRQSIALPYHIVTPKDL